MVSVLVLLISSATVLWKQCRQCMNERTWLCSNKSLFIKNRQQACRPQFADFWSIAVSMPDTDYLYLLSTVHGQSPKKLILLLFENKINFWVGWFSGHSFSRLAIVFFQQIEVIISLSPDLHFCCWEVNDESLWSTLKIISRFLFVLIGLVYFFRATFTANGSCQASSPIGATAASHNHSNTRSEPHLQPTPQLKATPDL